MYMGWWVWRAVHPVMREAVHVGVACVACMAMHAACRCASWSMGHGGRGSAWMGHGAWDAVLGSFAHETFSFELQGLLESEELRAWTRPV